MKNCIVLFVIALFVFSLSESSYGNTKSKKKKKKGQVEVVEKKPAPKPLSKYEKLFNKSGHVATENGFMTLHKVGNKLYFELPLKYMGREMLLASVASESSNDIFCKMGFKENDPMHIKFTLEDSSVCMRRVNAAAEFRMNEAREDIIRSRSFIDPLINTYKVEAYNKDSSAVVFDMTALFTGGEMSPVSRGGGVVTITASPKTNGVKLDEIKAFEDNVVVKTWYAYGVSLNMMGMITLMTNEPLTIKATRSLLLLPERKMRPRYSDSRVGIFLTEKDLISNDDDRIRKISFAHRWRLEPSDVGAYERGELVEPVKPIVWYVDDAFPESWIQPIKEGVLRWNKAFEKIGFKNVMQVRDFPKDDPDFDPDNLKYSCIRYIPSTTANAMGPSWVDPTTGEIVNASVIIYNDLIRLINQWRFTQTAQLDPRVRTKKMPDDVVHESLAYATAHEIGHTLGLMHNMSASSVYPVDSLRSASFTSKYGTTPSIMDYARYNYVAQPTDKGVNVSPPELGIYDEYAIKWLYTCFPKAKDEKEEAVILENWVDEKAGDPMYRYGKQQVAARFDPTALEEDLGDDAMKASDYGIRNLKYILAHVNEWITDDPDGSHRKLVYNFMANQYVRYLQNVIYNVGGIYLTEVKDGTPGKRFEPVPEKTQRTALKWVLKQVKSCDWLDNKDVTGKIGLDVAISTRVQALGAKMLFDIRKNVMLSSHIAKNPYTLSEYFDDLYNGVWESAIKGRKVTAGDRALQKMMLASISTSLADKNQQKLTLGITSGESFLPSVDEIYLYGLDESGVVEQYIDELRLIEAELGHGAVAKKLGLDQFGSGYGWQKSVEMGTIDETSSSLYAIAIKLEKLLAQAVGSAPDRNSREHYQMMLFELKRVMKAIM
ncbi:zinc-dependent metalloprotease [Butyricimonas sp. Marseille-P3923]|uniref:zinc-dependent metalloprotease n=1 Tax=Butyricimonas sp. Marseille-P3923 TaxID=1987504 RepID=UPI000C07EB1C|nr:zinc-dependent metalloprotease [Butyricimonas sp. Marseille-P3923]